MGPIKSRSRASWSGLFAGITRRTAAVLQGRRQRTCWVHSSRQAATTREIGLCQQQAECRLADQVGLQIEGIVDQCVGTKSVTWAAPFWPKGHIWRRVSVCLTVPPSPNVTGAQSRQRSAWAAISQRTNPRAHNSPPSNDRHRRAGIACLTWLAPGVATTRFPQLPGCKKPSDTAIQAAEICPGTGPSTSDSEPHAQRASVRPCNAQNGSFRPPHERL